MALYSDLVGAISQAAYFARLMARHVVNGVPTDTWLSVVNTGLSTTQYVSEVLAELPGSAGPSGDCGCAV